MQFKHFCGLRCADPFEKISFQFWLKVGCPIRERASHSERMQNIELATMRVPALDFDNRRADLSRGIPGNHCATNSIDEPPGKNDPAVEQEDTG